ncbi:MAG: acyl-ACP desaturase [Gemmataceae bacterium]|nr:acyl-ACP desaturase [Gemmataceae bacterium]
MDHVKETGRTAIDVALNGLYRQFFDRAEKKRRWSVRDDIPWEQTNPNLDPAIASVVESFCAVELFLPDYVRTAMSVFRSNRACAWFYANWGYEESKHSLVLGDWLLRSGQRSDEQLADLEGQLFQYEWQVPMDSAVGTLVYAMVQELATGVNYRNLRRRLDELGGDPALAKVLNLISVDEQSHHHFFLDAIRLYLEHDRAGTLRQMHRVLHSFAMPALHLLADCKQRESVIRSLGLFDEGVFIREVYEPILAALGVSRAELRRSA